MAKEAYEHVESSVYESADVVPSIRPIGMKETDICIADADILLKMDRIKRYIRGFVWMYFDQQGIGKNDLAKFLPTPGPELEQLYQRIMGQPDWCARALDLRSGAVPQVLHAIRIVEPIDCGQHFQRCFAINVAMGH